MPVLIGVAAVVGVLALVISRRPQEFRVVRSRTIDAPPAEVFTHVNDLHLWEAWSPWARLDPDMTVTFDGPAAGVGASYAWIGNKKVGAGSMQVTDSRPNELVQLRLEFLKPFKSTNTTEFALAPEGEGTQVTWTMIGHNNVMSKAFGVFVDMDKLIGKDFEKGLEQMKGVVEGGEVR
jgi:uncharacterized protein YndB with AHSA1/START domain